MLRHLAALAALTLLGCAARSSTFHRPTPEACGPVTAAPKPLRVASFNIRAALSSNLDRIAEVLAGIDADVIALQEVDVGVGRSGGVDQARALAERLGHRHAFAATIRRGGGDYGIALLSRLPILRVERLELVAMSAMEPRAALDADLCVAGRTVRVVAVHSDFLPWSAEANARQLLGLLGEPDDRPWIIAGDLNAGPGDAATRRFLEAGLVDLLAAHGEGPTYIEVLPRRLDYLLVDPRLAIGAQAHRVEEIASDHLPIVADFAPEALVALPAAGPATAQQTE